MCTDIVSYCFSLCPILHQIEDVSTLREQNVYLSVKVNKMF